MSLAAFGITYAMIALGHWYGGRKLLEDAEKARIDVPRVSALREIEMAVFWPLSLGVWLGGGC